MLKIQILEIFGRNWNSLELNLEASRGFFNKFIIKFIFYKGIFLNKSHFKWKNQDEIAAEMICLIENIHLEETARKTIILNFNFM